MFQKVSRFPRVRAIVVVMFSAVVLASCSSPPEEIDPNLTKAEMFQRAQEASDEERWETAMRHYEAFIERYPNDAAANAEARYEIAFLNYKMGEWETALTQFESLLQLYESTAAGTLPQWPRVLSEKLIQEIQEERQRSEEQ